MIRLDDITQVKDRKKILSNVDLSVARGDFFVLMGPTGCGKTTLLRIAGLLDKPANGTVSYLGEPVPDRGAGRLKVRRKVVTLFQRPHLFRGSVLSNVEWGLRIRGISGDRIAERVSGALGTVDLWGFENRDSSTLSGGELQRVALARALVIEPEVLILDEPTTSLDPGLRGSLLRKIRDIHERTGITVLMATHDFTDALSIGTTAAVMRDGTIEQTGSVEDIFYSPSTPFLASFVGMKNIFPAEFTEDGAVVEELLVRHTAGKRGQGFLAIPPESIVLSRGRTETSERNHFSGNIVSIEHSGPVFDVCVNCGNLHIISSVTRGALSELDLMIGSDVCISFKASAVHVF